MDYLLEILLSFSLEKIFLMIEKPVSELFAEDFYYF
jgi:hypothetical protein